MRKLMIATGFALAAQMTTAFAEETEKKAATQEEAKKADVEVTIEGNDKLQFDKSEFTVKEGQIVALTFKNVGNVPKAAMGHNVVILKKGTVVPTFAISCMANAQTTGLPTDAELAKQALVSTKLLGPGEEETVTFTAPEAGNYDYVCTFTGHFSVMKGVMKVEAK